MRKPIRPLAFEELAENVAIDFGRPFSLWGTPVTHGHRKLTAYHSDAESGSESETLHIRMNRKTVSLPGFNLSPIQDTDRLDYLRRFACLFKITSANWPVHATGQRFAFVA